MSRLDLSIIVVSFNTKDLTLACLRSIFRETTDISFEVLVVDNASADGSAEAIAAEFGDHEQVTFTPLEKNVGFAPANNIAAEAAKGEHVLLLNPDTEVLDHAIEKLLTFAKEDGGDGIYGGRTLFGDGSLNRTSCWGRFTPWSLTCGALGLSALFRENSFFDPESIGPWKRDTTRRVDIVTGCFLLLSHDLWNRLEGFDANFFMYYEEADLCLRAHQLGAKCTIYPEATIIHHGSQSERIPADKAVRILTARIQYVKKHWSKPTTLYAMMLIKGWVLGRIGVHSVLRVVRKESGKVYSQWLETWNRRREWAPSTS